MTLPEHLKILLAHGNSTTSLMLRKAFSDLGADVLPECNHLSDLVKRALESNPDLIVAGVELPDGNALDGLVAISAERSIPAIIVTPQRSLEIVEQALQDHVMAYMMEPINLAEVEPTVYLVLKRFEQFQELRQEVENLQQALSDRKEIERAKGVLMAKYQETEDAAHKRLRRQATDSRMKMVDAARQILSEQEAKA